MKRIYSISFYLRFGVLLLGMPQAYSVFTDDDSEKDCNVPMQKLHLAVQKSYSKSLEEKYLDLYQELESRFPKIKFRIENNQIIGELNMITSMQKIIHTLSLDLVESEAGFKGFKWENPEYSRRIESLPLFGVALWFEGPREISLVNFIIVCCLLMGFYAILSYLDHRDSKSYRIDSLKNDIILDEISVSSTYLLTQSIISGLQWIYSGKPTYYEKERKSAMEQIEEGEKQLASMKERVAQLASLSPSSSFVEEKREEIKDYKNWFQALKNDIEKLDAQDSRDKHTQASDDPQDPPGDGHRGYPLLILLLMFLLILGGTWLWTKKGMRN